MLLSKLILILRGSVRLIRLADHSLYVSPLKSTAILFGNKNVCRNIEDNVLLAIGSGRISLVNKVRNLGLIMNNSFRYRYHVSACISKAYYNLKMLYPFRPFSDTKTKLSLCNSLVLSHFNFCCQIYFPWRDTICRDRIQRIQNVCLRFAYGIRQFQHISDKLVNASWLNMCNRFKLLSACLFHKIILYKKPPYLYEKIKFRTDVHSLNIRFKGGLTPPLHKTALYEGCFSYFIFKIHKLIPDHLKNLSASQFRTHLRRVLSSR